jgi:GDPmannose 4,6-dehydratase
MTALLFGANGQDGYYLSQLLTGNAINVIAVSRKESEVIGDVADHALVKKLVEQYRPDYIFHLAANSTTRHDALFENHAAISTGTLNILEAVKTISPKSKVFISGSGLQFKNTGQPIGETDPFEARDAYSVSRIQSVYAARYYRTLGIQAYVGYFFNHDSPRRTERHVAKMIANDVKRIGLGEKESMEIGDMSVQKEWGFAGDIVKAIWTLVNQDAVFEATLGTGESWSIQDYLEACFSFIGKDWKEYVRSRPGFEAGYKRLVSDPATIHSLGWKPETTFQQLVKIMLTQP